MPRLELHSYVFANYFLYLFNCFWHYIYRAHYVNSLEICHRLWKVSFGSELFIVSCELSLSLSLSQQSFQFPCSFRPSSAQALLRACGICETMFFFVFPITC